MIVSSPKEAEPWTRLGFTLSAPQGSNPVYYHLYRTNERRHPRVQTDENGVVTLPPPTPRQVPVAAAVPRPRAAAAGSTAGRRRRRAR